MSIIRTNDQADAVEILQLIIKTAEFHRAMGELLTKENINHSLFDIAQEREAYIEPFQKIVKSLDELPSRPDADKEYFDELGGKITTLLSDDSKSALLDKCLEKDDILVELINRTALGEHATEFKKLLDSLNDHLTNTKARIKN